MSESPKNSFPVSRPTQEVWKFEGSVIHGRSGDRIFSAKSFEDIYPQAVTLLQKNKHASCFEMMEAFSIGYAESVILMDALELEGYVGPVKMNGDVPTRGPRPAKASKMLPPQQVVLCLEDASGRIQEI
jgi:DNA segregation ATPase FtsK/SpoIIIE-like protein